MNVSLYIKHIYSIGCKEINARQFIYGIKVRHIYIVHDVEK